MFYKNCLPIFIVYKQVRKTSDGADVQNDDKAVESDLSRVTALPTRSTLGMYGHHFIMYEFMLCSAVSVALLVLIMWHARLVTRGETSIEVHTNHTEKKRMRKKGLVSEAVTIFQFRQNHVMLFGERAVLEF